jgi:D-aminopeptidase
MIGWLAGQGLAGRRPASGMQALLLCGAHAPSPASTCVLNHTLPKQIACIHTHTVYM